MLATYQEMHDYLARHGFVRASNNSFYNRITNTFVRVVYNYKTGLYHMRFED